MMKRNSQDPKTYLYRELSKFQAGTHLEQNKKIN